VRLLPVEPVAERGSRGRSGPARVFPLRFGRQPKFPVLGEVPRSARPLGQPLAEGFCLREIDVADWIVITLRQFSRQFAGQGADDALPQSLRRFVLRHPESAREGDFDLVFSRSPFRLTTWASHDEAPRRAPAESNFFDLTLLTGSPADERRRRLLCPRGS